MKHAVLGTNVLAFAIHRLRRGQHDLFDCQPLFDNQLEQQRGAAGIDRDKGAEIRQVVLVSIQMKNVTHPDRKSTRLNSSHSQISYAVFCLKKKKKTNQNTMNNRHIK